ncbi:MAG: adenine deaminase C-terminal domain-containing protein [Christensenellaceae bacterium]|nr:adenine deaminase C-terminal domain-containing protein [Christensenellaceae bacterium]MEA5069713.1 adenine deaminase C-terminal domain-containing protein [Christensenellaceae bacterium]
MVMRIRNAKVFNSALRRFVDGDIVVRDGRFLYAFLDETADVQADQTIDAEGRFALPSLIDIHLHVESSMVTPRVFSDMLIRNGVTTCVAEPHEIANVFGVEGVEAFLRQGRTCAADIFGAIPSSVPCTPFETTGGRIELDDALRLIERNPDIVALGEVMNCVSVLNEPDGKIRTWLKVLRERYPNLTREGHISYYNGKELCEIAYHGVDSDHTSQGLDCFINRITQGVFVELQEKTLTPETVKWIEDNDLWQGFGIVTDDVMPDRLFSRGHLNVLFRKAIALGMKPERAIMATTYNPAQRMKLHDRGMIAPGKLADFVLLDSVEDFKIHSVYKGGAPVFEASNPAPVTRKTEPFFPAHFYQSVRLDPLTAEDFRLRAPENAGARVLARIMAIEYATTLTMERFDELSVDDGLVDYENSPYCLIAVFDRYSGEAKRAYGLIGGPDFIHAGAIASSYAHDHHNLLVAGKTARDLMTAANWVIEHQGGICVANDGKVIAALGLEVGGIVTEAPMAEVARNASAVTKAMEALGYHHPNPLMSFGCLGLGVSRALRLTDMGYVKTAEGRLVPLFE